ncbi:hypothetical protein D3C80_1324840 [compost metagenome]
MNAFLFNLAHCAQAEHLEAAGIGEDRAMPLHEIMQIAMQLHDFLAWAQPQVEGVAQQDLRAGLFHFFRRHAFYRAVGADRHKGRGFHHATVKDQAATASAAIGSV